MFSGVCSRDLGFQSVPDPITDSLSPLCAVCLAHVEFSRGQQLSAKGAD